MNEIEDGTIEDDNANANEVQNIIAGESDENEASAPLPGIESPINTNEPINPNEEAQDFLSNSRVDVQPIDSMVLDEIRRRILDRDPLIDEPALSRPSISNDRSSARGVATSVVNAGNSANNGSGLPPIELAEEERFILEEDDTSSDSDSNGSEENDEEREEESNGNLIDLFNSFIVNFMIKFECFAKIKQVKMKMKMKPKIEVI